MVSLPWKRDLIFSLEKACDIIARAFLDSEYHYMIKAFGLTHQGLQRNNNEDTLLVQDSTRLYLVADGMGGHRSGELASNRAAALIDDFVKQTDLSPEITWPFGYSPDLSVNANRLINALKLANSAIWTQAGSDPAHHGMGTTVVCLLIDDGVATFASAGDSRLYLLRSQRLRQLTQDDSWWDAANHAQEFQNLRHVLTKAVGVEESLDVSPHDVELKAGDQLLLSTDGLHSVIPQEELAEILKGEAQLEEKVEHLIERANELGGPDNITALLIRYDAANMT